MCATAEAQTITTASCQARCRRRASERERKTSANPNATAPTRAAVGIPGGSMELTSRTRSLISGVSPEMMLITPTAAAAQASSDSGLGVDGRKRTEPA